MFDLGFPEILMIVIVALVVLGPKRMPQLVRQVGRWVGKARAMARQFREQLESEVDLEDLASNGKHTASTPAPPPEFTGAPVAASDASNSNQDGTYPYGSYPYAAPPVESPPPAAPQPGDDTYSHAHAAGEAPLAADEPAVVITERPKDSSAA